jgi:hypothetical protein
MKAPMTVNQIDLLRLIAKTASNSDQAQALEESWVANEIEVEDFGTLFVLTEEGRAAALLAGLEDTRHGLEWAQPRRR